MLGGGLAEKAILIGLDSATPDFILKFVDEGLLPNLERLIRGGVFAEGIGATPTLTGPNWPTIATGAWPGTHGVTDMWVHIPGEPLDRVHSGFLTTYCRAEYLWDAAERAGKRSIILKYACAVPRTMRTGIQVDGYATPWWGSNVFEISPCRCFSTQPYPKADRVELTQALGWKNAPVSRSAPLEASLEVRPRTGSGRIFNILVLDSGGKGFDRLIISPSKDAAETVADMGVGGWSPWLSSDFLAVQGAPAYMTQEISMLDEEGGRIVPFYEEAEARRVRGTFRFKLVELSPDAKRFRLYLSQVYPTTGYTYPDHIAEELMKAIGPFQEHIGPHPLYNEWIDEETYLEEMEYQADWLGRAADYLMSNHEWDLLFLQWHGLNHAQHSFWAGIDPISPWYDPSNADRYWDVFRRFYQMADRMVGRITKRGDAETLVIVLSDHGHVPLVSGEILIPNALIRAGLMRVNRGAEGRIEVDWSRTMAYPQRSVHIYVNLKGRDPKGIVGAGGEYEEVRDRVIDALYSIRDPKGRCPVALALRREEAEAIGLHGDRTGDIVYLMRPGYHASTLTITEDLEPFSFGKAGARTMSDDVGLRKKPTSVHTQYMGTMRLGLGTLRVPFIMCGPGVKKGYRLRRTIRLVDVAPTVAHMLGIPTPAQSEGTVIREALETTP